MYLHNLIDVKDPEVLVFWDVCDVLYNISYKM